MRAVGIDCSKGKREILLAFPTGVVRGVGDGAANVAKERSIESNLDKCVCKGEGKGRDGSGLAREKGGDAAEKGGNRMVVVDDGWW